MAEADRLLRLAGAAEQGRAVSPEFVAATLTAIARANRRRTLLLGFVTAAALLVALPFVSALLSQALDWANALALPALAVELPLLSEVSPGSPALPGLLLALMAFAPLSMVYAMIFALED